ncbi:hypothetical protein PanWU01x14_140530 [Parasponia andersonii]|uniref:Uncharacterized protein n=1 Tax=Parasponia andersonii TaxID=3476 RepID=A0A2P5CLY5_PARAD|nr:hypothetical protein PanWU01x14_140530 [Parasponia andersonii]
MHTRHAQILLLHFPIQLQSTFHVFPPSKLLEKTIISRRRRTNPVTDHLVKQVLCILKPPTRAKTLHHRSIRRHSRTNTLLSHFLQLIKRKLRLMCPAIDMKNDRKTRHVGLNPSAPHFVEHLLCIPYRPLEPLLRVQTRVPANPIQQHIVRDNIGFNPSLHHVPQKSLGHVDPANLTPPIDQNSVHFHIGTEPISPLVENFSRDPHVPVLTKGIKQEVEIPRRRFGPNKGLNIVKGADRLPGQAGGYQSSDEDEEGGRGGGEAEALHLEDELPSDVVLADLGDDVDKEIVRGGGERRVRELLGVVEEGEGNFGIVFEPEEGLVEEVPGERDSMELERRFHGVERVVVVEKELRHGIGVV